MRCTYKKNEKERKLRIDYILYGVLYFVLLFVVLYLAPLKQFVL